MPAAARWLGPAVAVAAAIAALVAGCTSGDGDGSGGSGASGASAAGRSSTIAWSGDGRHLWVTSPDDDHVVAVDARTLEAVGSVAVAGQPAELTVVGDRVVVTGAQRTSLAVLDDDPTAVAEGAAGATSEVAELPVPCGAPRSVVGVPGGTGSLVAVTCPVDDRVVVADLDEAAVVAVADVPGRPTGLVHDGEHLLVSLGLTGEIVRWDLDAVRSARPDAAGPAELPGPEVARTAWADADRTPSLLGALDVGAVGPVGAYQVVDNDRSLSSRQLEGDPSYGSPLDGRARLEPAIAGACGARFADFGDPPRILALPVALAADPDDDLVWVVGQSSRSVSVVRCREGGPSGRSTTVAAFDVGDGPRGIVLAPDGRSAFVDVGFDHEVARLDLPEGWAPSDGEGAIERSGSSAVGQRSVDDGYLSPLAQTGRRMFHDATDRHLTPFGVVSCASCHPAAGDDGLTWRIETSSSDRKLRRTPPVWQVDASAKPLHWDGEFTDVDDLTLTTIRELLGGDGLLVDTAAITAYLAEALAPPGAPAVGEAGVGAWPSAVVAEGEALFEGDALGCASCHTGSNGSDGRFHDVLDAVGERSQQLEQVVTPTLTGVRGRAPYGHDGRAATLADLLAEHRGVDGRRFDLRPDELEAVVAYLATR